jgi:hypothetical protein|tara:strand:+ start:409 stop:540 length:132 start_codon:yes stop_codon:yes gene_type:complete
LLLIAFCPSVLRPPATAPPLNPLPLAAPCRPNPLLIDPLLVRG